MIKLKNIPNILTVSRLLCCPIWLILFYYDFYFICLIIIVYSALSDFFDGYIARRYDASSIIGKTLDPIADKLFACTVLISFISDSRADFIIVIIILMREIIISGLREVLSKYNKSNILDVTFLSKIKTTFQFLSIFILALVPINVELSEKFQNIGSILLLITTILTIYTGYKYVIKSIIEINKIKRE